MAVFIYCARSSSGAAELADAIRDGCRVRKFDGEDFWKRGKRIPIEPGDTIVCWGAGFPEVDGVNVLNAYADHLTKRDEALLLGHAKIPTIGVMTIHPEKHRQTYDYATNPADWIPRVNNHVGGNDLLNPPAKPDFWVKRETFVREFRLHHFAGKCIRAGEKVHRDGFNRPHPWVRSYDAGWKIQYDGFASTKQLRMLAKRSVKALRFTFGAVDVGERADGSLVVLEVNKAPGLEGNTIQAYAKAIERWTHEPGRTEAADSDD